MRLHEPTCMHIASASLGGRACSQLTSDCVVPSLLRHGRDMLHTYIFIVVPSTTVLRTTQVMERLNSMLEFQHATTCGFVCMWRHACMLNAFSLNNIVPLLLF